MTYKIAICDDMEQDTQYIASAAKKWAEQENVCVDIHTFPSAEGFLFDYAEHKDYDILLLDIEMPSMNGVELAKRIRQENDAVQIVFITGYSDYIAEGYDVAALHYLMKPVSFDKLFAVMNRATDKLNKTEKSIIMAVDGESLRIAVSDIVAVEAFAHFCTLTTIHARFEVKASITAVEKMLNESAGGEFVRCHRSYIVGVKYIKSISKTDVTLDNGAKIPLSRSHCQAVNQAFIRYFKGESPWD